MPFANNRIYYVIGVLAFVVFLAFVVNASLQGTNSATPTPTPPPQTMPPQSDTILVTIKTSIGIDHITITNLNTGQIYIASIIDLPPFNCTRGDYLRLTVTTQPGYQWNAWWFSPMGIFDQHNPLTFTADGSICVNNQIIITPKCLITDTPPTNSSGSP